MRSSKMCVIGRETRNIFKAERKKKQNHSVQMLLNKTLQKQLHNSAIKMFNALFAFETYAYLVLVIPVYREHKFTLFISIFFSVVVAVVSLQFFFFLSFSEMLFFRPVKANVACRAEQNTEYNFGYNLAFAFE